MMKASMNTAEKMTAAGSAFVFVGATAAKTVGCFVFDFIL